MLAAEMVARSTALAEVAGLETTVRRLAAEQAESLAEVELLLAEVSAELATERASSARAVAEGAAEVTAAQAAVGRAATERALLRRAMEEMEEQWAVPAAMTAAGPVTAAVTRTGGRQRKAARLARQAATEQLEASLGADWQETVNGRLEVARAHWMLKQ